MGVTLLRYSEHMEAVQAEYGPKAMALLERIKALFVEQGYEVNGPFDMCADDFRWSMLVTAPGMRQEKGMDLTVEIVEERSYDDAEGWGLNFGLDIVRYGGRLVGGLTPFNFTPECWVDSRDSEAVAVRWAYVGDCDAQEAVDLVLADFTARDH